MRKTRRAPERLRLVAALALLAQIFGPLAQASSALDHAVSQGDPAATLEQLLRSSLCSQTGAPDDEGGGQSGQCLHCTSCAWARARPDAGRRHPAPVKTEGRVWIADLNGTSSPFARRTLAPRAPPPLAAPRRLDRERH